MDEPRGRGAEKGDGVCLIARGAIPFEGPFVAKICCVDLSRGQEARGGGRAGADAIDAHVTPPRLVGQASRVVDDGGLDRRVRHFG